MNAKQLKDSILQYAMQGKLVPQNQNDEPASELLKRIAEEKQRLIKEGVIKKEKPLPPISEEEIPFDIPDSWEWVRLKDISTFGNFETSKPETISENEWILDLEEIEKGTGRLLLKVLNVEKRVKSNKYKFQTGDVLYGKLRPYLNKVIVAPDKGYCTTEIVPIRLVGNINSRYIQCVLMSPYFINYANNCSYGVKMPRLGTNQLAEAMIPLPSLNEQIQIVNKIEELLYKIEEYENTHFEADELKKRFPLNLEKSILQYAMQGKLVEQDPNDEPAQLLVEKIRVEKERLVKEKLIKKEKPLPPITEEEIPFDIPSSWEWVRLGDIVHKINDGTHSTPKYVTNGVPFLSVKDMSSGKLDFSNTKYITHEEHKELYKRCNPEIGDVLLTKVGTTGIPVLVDTDIEFSLFVSVALIKFNQKCILNRYLIYALQSPLLYQQSQDGTRGVGNKNLVIKTIKEFLFPLPPIEEQVRIVEAIESLINIKNQI